MTIPSDGPLATLLAKGAALGVATPQVYPGYPETALAFFLDAVESAILPRSLCFSDPQGDRLTVLASGGQVQDILEWTGRGEDADAPLPNPMDIDQITSLLRNFFAGDTHVELTVALPDDSMDPTQKGLDAATLMAALGLARIGCHAEDRLAYFLDAAQELLVGEWRPEKGITWQGSEGQQPADLGKHISALSDQLSLPIGTLGQNDLLVLDPITDELALVLTNSAAGIKGFLFEAGSGTDLAAYWASLPHDLAPIDAG